MTRLIKTLPAPILYSVTLIPILALGLMVLAQVKDSAQLTGGMLGILTIVVVLVFSKMQHVRKKYRWVLKTENISLYGRDEDALSERARRGLSSKGVEYFNEEDYRAEVPWFFP